MLNLLRRFFPLNSPVRKAWYFTKAVLATFMYRFPARHLRLIGITGTDGKTTTTGMISEILQIAGIPHLKISTATIFLNGREWENATKRTTLSPFLTQKLLRRAVREKAETVILEVSSHALEQNRLWKMEFDFAGITNVTEEHLDDHGGFTAYANAKKKLFTRYLRPNGTTVLNADDPTIRSWDSEIKAKKIWITEKKEAMTEGESTLMAENISFGAKGATFTVEGQAVALNLLGNFHVQNALIAYGIAKALSIPGAQIAAGLARFSGTPGRLEKVPSDQPFSIYIDDALTPNAVEQGLISLRKVTPGKLWAVFGCAGARDKGKRPKIGNITGRLADYVILTDDEPYMESAEQIREDVKEGIQGTKVWNSPFFQEIPDRREAIEYALKNAQPDDTIWIFGMGSFTSRNIEGREVPWSDKEVIEEILMKDS